MDNQNFQIKQNLLKFNNAFVMNIKGKTASKQCICIPDLLFPLPTHKAELSRRRAGTRRG